MKEKVAWHVFPSDMEYGDVVFAETRNKARFLAIEICDGFEDLEYVDVHARRLPKADNQCKGRNKMDWYNDEDRLFLAKEYGFWCGGYIEPDDCKCCCANQYCEEYKIYKELYADV